MTALADTSAWVEFLRHVGSPTNVAIRGLLADGQLLVTDVVRMEILAGARDDEEEGRLDSMMALSRLVPVVATDWSDAARLHRGCRRGGETVRRMTDCLIAAVAIRADVPVLHRDKDFDVLARHTALRVYA